MYYRRWKYEIPTFKRVILLIDIEVQKGNTAVLTLKDKNDTAVSSIVRYKRYTSKRIILRIWIRLFISMKS